MYTWIPIVVSALALAVSLISLWKNYLSPFNPRISFDAPTFSLYKITPQISGGESAWWIPSFDMGFTFTNLGSRVGDITDIRLLVSLSVEGVEKIYPFYAKWLVDYQSFTKIGSDRMKWISNAVMREWYPLILAGKAQQSAHLVLEGFRWDQKLSGAMDVRLQMFSSQKNKWVEYARYTMPISKRYFEEKSKYSLGDPKLTRIRAGRDDWHETMSLPAPRLTSS